MGRYSVIADPSCCPLPLPPYRSTVGSGCGGGGRFPGGPCHRVTAAPGGAAPGGPGGAGPAGRRSGGRPIPRPAGGRWWWP